jgi:DNA polymerase elongation subunit (family B)
MGYISAARKGDDVLVWERNEDGERELNHHRAPFYFYVKDEEGTEESIFGDKLSRVDFGSYDEFSDARTQNRRNGVDMFESDLPPELKYLSQKFYNQPAPKLHTTMFDIEVDYNKKIGFSTIDNPYAPINAVALYHDWSHRMVVYVVLPTTGSQMVAPDGTPWTDESLLAAMDDVEKLPDDVQVEVYICLNEKELLLSILEEINDSDIICGWNSDFFDVPYVAKRIEKVLGNKYFKQLSFPHARKPRFREVEMYGRANTTIDIFGRVSWDYLALFKKYEMAERPSYKLESIANEVVPELPKLSYTGTLADLFITDLPLFIRYNLRDTEVLKGFEEKLGYVALANEMYHMSTGLDKHVLGTLKLAELAINNYCNHELGLRFPDMGEPETGGSITGAYVLEPDTGMHDWIGSIDINSLYPSAIRSINISPEKIIGQFDDAVKAAKAIAEGSYVSLVLTYEDNSEEEHTADEWREILQGRKQAISGFGTVFSQEKEGIIPAILNNWYSMRKNFQAKKAQAEGNEKAYYDRLQYVYKIKLNSLYGALTNAFFRYFDLRMGESTTGTGRAILTHQCAQTNKVMTGEYDHLGEAILYGDTDSTYFSLYAENAEEAVLIADAAGEKVTESFQKFMQDTFLCQPGFDDIIKAGREVVASRGIFVEKKRYILRVIDNEGEKVDKLKVMGLDTKKTTIPPAIGKKLNEYVGRLLKGEEWDDIAKDIVDFKHYVETTDDVMDIGLPKGVNKVEDYTERLLHDANTRLPGHVAAAIHYNQLLEEYGDKDSEPIISGMKIKVFYLTRKYGKFHSIAIPTDAQEVPEWFLANYTISRDKHIARLIDNPLGNIIKAIGKEVPTKQSLVVDDLLGF